MQKLNIQYIEKTYCKTEYTVYYISYKKKKKKKYEKLNFNKAQRNVLKLIYHKVQRIQGSIVTKSFCCLKGNMLSIPVCSDMPYYFN